MFVSERGMVRSPLVFCLALVWHDDALLYGSCRWQNKTKTGNLLFLSIVIYILVVVLCTHNNHVLLCSCRAYAYARERFQVAW